MKRNILISTLSAITIIAGVVGFNSFINAKQIHSYVTLCPRVYLGGCYDSISGLMNDSLRIKGLIPHSEPYTNLGYVPVSEPSNEVLDSSVFSVSGDSAIVDWVVVELRGTNINSITATRRALLLRNGYVVDVDGVSPVSFTTMSYDSYYVSVKHRNHLAVMTQNQFYLTNDTQVDFTTVALWGKPNITNSQTKNIGAVRVLWSGDANTNKIVKYNGNLNDKQTIYDILGGNNQLVGYRNEDVNMDGIIRYNGVNNDKDIISNNCIISGGTPNGMIYAHIPN